MKIQSVRFFESVLLPTRQVTSESKEVTYISPPQCEQYGWDIHLETSPVPHIAIRDATGKDLNCVPLGNVKHWQPLPAERIVTVNMPVTMTPVAAAPAPAAHVVQNVSQRPRKYPKTEA
jgi:hypothetical protein